MLDLPPDPPKLWLPPKPAIIRAAPELLRPAPLAFVPGLAASVSKRRLQRTYIDAASSTSDLTTYNFGDFTAPRAGLMVIAAEGRSSSSRTVSTVSIGGSGGTIHQNPSGSANPCVIASRVVSAGANAVSVTFSGSMVRAAVQVWLLENYISATPLFGDGLQNNSGATSIQISFVVPYGGLAIYAHAHGGSNGTTWSTATQRGNYDALEGFSTHAGGELMGAGASVTQTCSWTGSETAGLAGAAWR